MKYEISIAELKTIVDLVESAHKDLGFANVIYLNMHANEKDETELSIVQTDPRTKTEITLQI